MPANSVDYAADETKAAVNSAAEAATKLSAEAQRSFADAAKRIERAVTEGHRAAPRPDPRLYRHRRPADRPGAAIHDRAGQANGRWPPPARRWASAC